jgi:hypothetical protein
MNNEWVMPAQADGKMPQALATLLAEHRSRVCGPHVFTTTVYFGLIWRSLGY